MDDTVVTGRDGIGSDYRWTIEEEPVHKRFERDREASKDSRCVRSLDRERERKLELYRKFLQAGIRQKSGSGSLYKRSDQK